MNCVNILDYGCGNILSLKRAIIELGFDVKFCSDEKTLIKSNYLILPGVGAFENAMNLLKKRNLVDALKEYCLIKKKTNLRYLSWYAIIINKKL